MKLSDPLSNHFRIDKRKMAGLKRLGIFSIRDLLWHFPSRYSNIAVTKMVREVKDGDEATIFGTVENIKLTRSRATKTPMSEAMITDRNGDIIRAVWFHQPYIAKMIKEGQVVKLVGKISIKKTRISLANPTIDKVDSLPIDVSGSLFGDSVPSYGLPIYPETNGLSSKWIYYTILRILSDAKSLKIMEHIPEYLLEKLNLPILSTALVWIHMPKSEKHALVARKRFAFDEIFSMQLVRQRLRFKYEAMYTDKYKIDKQKLDDFIRKFPFELTVAQKNAIGVAVRDIESQRPMERLLEGDVGSGKTAVAASVSYAVAMTRPKRQSFGHMQVAYMAPTEVLAKQLYESFIEYFEGTNMMIGLVTGKECRKFPSKTNSEKWTKISRAQILKWIISGEIPIVVGTHALLSEKVKFKNLGIVIIDEQHRFGIGQRMTLAKKEGHSPHFLSMTATPIPRTLALTVYGDLDLSILDELPAGRKVVKTTISSASRRGQIYEKLRERLKEGRQVYVICPRIDEADPNKESALQLASVKATAKQLTEKVFPEFSVGIMHSKMKKDEKDKVMEEFAEGKIQILVSTSVIEVGVNVPNATSIMIEGADRFGLAQLHQLRGRVQRGSFQSYCYLISDSAVNATTERLQALQSSADGFVLAEHDLMQRGSGGLLSGKQWGMSDISMEALRNIKLVETARESAKEIVGNDPNLDNFPLLKMHLKPLEAEMHLE